MPASLATIPKTAPFQEEEIDLLNRVVGPASPTQRAWLAGFLAGATSLSNAPQPAPSAHPAEPLTIVFASESGNCERLAGDVAKAARRAGMKPVLVDMVDRDLDFSGPAALWINQTLETLAPPEPDRSRVIEVDFGARPAPSPEIVEAEIIEHINLNSSRSEKETIH